MKRRSDTKRSPKLPSLVYFIDRCLGRGAVPQAVREAGFHVELMDDHFDHRTKDHVWIPEVAARGWVIVTKDKAILSKPAERAALERARAHYVAVVARDRKGVEIGAALSAHIERVNATIHAAGQPSWFRVRMAEGQILLEGKWRPIRVMHSNPNRWKRGRFT